ncbi:MAG TPA: DedA family protein [Vicinamibacterales bacterium]|nr:DedA family protein [Vicinamibacterales bacterium]
MFEWITGIIARLGYVGVAGLTFLENVFPPIPSELVIPLAGYVAAEGQLQLVPVIVTASIGSLAGASLWYWVGRRVGEQRLRAWVDRHGKWLTLSGRDVDKAKQWFSRHGNAAVFFGRLVPGVRTLISLPAGFAKMPALPFLLYSALGTAIWTVALAYAGVTLQSNFTIVGDYINMATNVILGICGVVMAMRYYKCWTAH